MVTKKSCKIKDDYGKEYKVTFIYGNLTSSIVAKELVSLCNLSLGKSEVINKEGVVLGQQIGTSK